MVVAVVGAVIALGILLPQQLQRYPFLTGLFELLVEHGPIRERFVAGFGCRSGAEEGTLQGDIIPAITERPGSDLQLSSTIEVIGYGAG